MVPSRYTRAIRYWLKLITCSDNKYIKLAYKVQLQWLAINLNKEFWAIEVRIILYSYGMGEAWLNLTDKLWSL
jgi:hypothetical protein